MSDWAQLVALGANYALALGVLILAGLFILADVLVSQLIAKFQIWWIARYFKN